MEIINKFITQHKKINNYSGLFVNNLLKETCIRESDAEYNVECVKDMLAQRDKRYIKTRCGTCTYLTIPYQVVSTGNTGSIDSSIVMIYHGTMRLPNSHQV